MSKCPECGGTGKVVHPMMSMNGDEYTGEWEQHECEACNGTGEVELTNEEYIRQCSTEELVKMILDMCEDKPCFACGIGYCDDENWCHVYRDEAREFVLEWLKEKHNG